MSKIGDMVKGIAQKVADGVMSGLDAAGSIVDDVTPDNVDVPVPSGGSGGGGSDEAGEAAGALLDPESVGVIVDVVAGGIA